MVDIFPSSWLHVLSGELKIDETFKVGTSTNAFALGDVAKTGHAKLGFEHFKDAEVVGGLCLLLYYLSVKYIYILCFDQKIFDFRKSCPRKTAQKTLSAFFVSIGSFNGFFQTTTYFIRWKRRSSSFYNGSEQKRVLPQNLI
jgi:hypothetical protein